MRGKQGKAPSKDGINYSFFKSLPQNWLLFMQLFFNNVWDTGKTPEAWRDLVMLMIHKKDAKCLRLSTNHFNKLHLKNIYANPQRETRNVGCRKQSVA